MSESAASAAVPESTSIALIGTWGDQATDYLEQSSEEEVAFTPVRGGGSGAPASETSLPYGMTLKDLQKFLANAKLRYGNRINNSTERVQRILTNPATPAGKIVWVVSGPEYNEDEIVVGSSDADKFIAAHEFLGHLPRNVGLQIFAFLITGFDARPCDGGEPLANLTDYLPGAKCVKDTILDRLDALERVHVGARYEIMPEDRNPLVLRVQVLNPVTAPLVTHHFEDGTTITQIVPVQSSRTAPRAAPAVPTYASRTGGARAAPVAQTTPVVRAAPTPRATPAPRAAPIAAPTVVTRAIPAPAFNGALLSEILADLAPYVGKSAQELERMHARGALSSAVLRLLRE